MGKMRVFSIMLALLLVLTFVPTSQASATDYACGVWLRQVPYGDGVTIAVCADAQVAAGVITITYNKDVLTFQQLKLENEYVLNHAINADEAGVIKISWIGTGAELDTKGHVLMWLEFAGMPDLSAVMTGTIYDAAGNKLAITTLNTTGLEAVMTQAETLKAEDYTADSFAAVQTALQEAKAVLNQAAVTQSQLDDAAKKLTSAMEHLVENTPEPPATEPAPTDPVPTDPAPTQPKPTQPGSDTKPTQAPTTQAGIVAPKRDNGWMIYALVAICAVAAVAVVVILKKRGRK